MTPVIPIAAVDPIQAVEMSGRAAAWVASVFARRKDRRERTAALVLRELAMLSAWCHALNNAGRVVTQPLIRLSSTWSQEDRQRVVDGLDAFLATTILSEIDKSAAALGSVASQLAA